MNKSDPNTWTESYVSSNRAECLRDLRDVNSQVMVFIRQKNYLPAITGLDRILNGLVTMQNGKCGDFRSHIAMFSLCEGAIIVFGDFGKSVSESRQRETALKCFEDARDFSKSAAAKENIRSIIAELKSGVPLARIKAEQGTELSESMVLDMLADLNSQLSAVSSSASSNAGSGGCYIATAVYGSYDCLQVWTLRRYRDSILASTWYGRTFVHIYYTISPTLVRWVGRTAWFQKLWKSILDRMVKRLNANGIANTPYEDKEW